MSLCRQIPGCSLSPTGAGGSTASAVGQPLISAARDSEDESCVSIALPAHPGAALGAATACPGQEGSEPGQEGSAPAQCQPRSTQSQDKLGTQDTGSVRPTLRNTELGAARRNRKSFCVGWPQIILSHYTKYLFQVLTVQGHWLCQNSAREVRTNRQIFKSRFRASKTQHGNPNAAIQIIWI